MKSPTHAQPLQNMDSATRRRSVVPLLVLYFAAFLQAGNAAKWYVEADAAGTADGTSEANAWTSFSSINQNKLSAGDTVLIYFGTYNERFILSNSGKSAYSRITYKGVNDGRGMPILRGLDGGNCDYIAVLDIEFTQLSSANNYAAIRMAGCTGWLIQDNYIHDTYGAGIDGRVNTENSNNIIRANMLENISGIGGGVNNSIAITMTGDSNLIEYNTIMKGLDRVQAFGTGDVIRNNYWGATDTSLYPNSTPYPYHNDGFQSFNTANPLTKLLCERNWDMDNADSVGATNGHGYTIQNYGSAGLLNWMIFRFNVLVRPAGAAFIFLNIDNIYVYNMTCIGIYSGSKTLYQNAVGYNSGGIGSGQDWRNNSWCYSPNTMDYAGIVPTVNRPTDSSFDYEHSYEAGVVPLAPHNLPYTYPYFTDVASDSYTLQVNSILRGSGGPITTATAAGTNSTTVFVADAKRLFDGWGIADADLVKIGTGGYSRILSIDYTKNTMVLNTPRTWNNGDPIFVKGMEDIGAQPYAYALPLGITNTSPTSIPAGAKGTLTANCPNPDAVRKVEFLVDGIPMGICTSTPYCLTWTSDGLAHSIEARAYNAWASTILFKSDTCVINAAAAE